MWGLHALVAFLHLALRDLLCEALDQATGELPREEAQRRLQKIEDRVIDEDEEAETDRNMTNAPSILYYSRSEEGVWVVSCSSTERVLWELSPKRLFDEAKLPPSVWTPQVKAQQTHSCGTAAEGDACAAVWRELLAQKRRNSRN